MATPRTEQATATPNNMAAMRERFIFMSVFSLHDERAAMARGRDFFLTRTDWQGLPLLGDASERQAFTSTPDSFSSALITAEAFSLPKPSATADARFFLIT